MTAIELMLSILNLFVNVLNVLTGNPFFCIFLAAMVLSLIAGLIGSMTKIAR